MAASKSPVLKQILYTSGQSPDSPLHLDVEGKPHLALVSQERLKSKVPTFGEWEGGENYTVFFDNARKKKSNGQMINSNDPQDNPDMLPQSGGTAQAPRSEPKEQQSKAPEFGAWNNGENVAYTEYFEKKGKPKNGQPTASANDPQMDRGMHPRKDPPAQARPASSKSEPKQEARAKVPAFGAWEGGGEVGYTQSFQNVRKNNKNGGTVTPEPPSDAPQLNRDVSEPPPKEGRSKVPQFGGWNEGTNGAYTAYFENARKNKNAGPVLDHFETQLNGDVNNRPRPPTAVGTRSRVDDHRLRNASRGPISYFASSDTPPLNHNGSLVNMARNPLLNEDFISERGPLAWADYGGGGKRLTVWPRGGNDNDVSQIRYASQAFPAYTAGSTTHLRKESKLVQGRSKVPQFGGWNEGENGDYTAYFENDRKNKNAGPVVHNSQGSLVNIGSSPPQDEELISERGPLARADDGGGGRRSTIALRGGKDNGVSQISYASHAFPASTAGSKTNLRKESKLLQLWRLFQKKGAAFFKKAKSIPRGI